MKQNQFQTQKYCEYKNTALPERSSIIKATTVPSFEGLLSDAENDSTCWRPANYSAEVLPNTQFSDKGGREQH